MRLVNAMEKEEDKAADTTDHCKTAQMRAGPCTAAAGAACLHADSRHLTYDLKE